MEPVSGVGGRLGVGLVATILHLLMLEAGKIVMRVLSPNWCKEPEVK